MKDKLIYKNRLGITVLKADVNNMILKKHSHEEYHFAITLKGEQKYILDGKPINSYENGITIFNPEQIHESLYGNYEYILLLIKPQLLLEAMEQKDIIKFSSSLIYNEKLKEDLLKLSNAVLTQQDELFFSEQFLKVVDNFTKKDYVFSYNKEKDFIKKSKEMIYYELEDILNLDQISQEFNLSKFQFIRRFKENTGITPYQYFLNTKLNHAKSYLDSTKDLYGAVVEFGFSDLSHFNRLFKRVYGTTPFEYINSINK
ncbi:AraC family transcriptional regulator [Aliarcobacter lanthieri]|uniref:AraC family transcriptional regulator n=1 Tax=Aliarcobacter lanthieri TaxID=1355374 RepID=UPI00047EE6A4|nr:AraC family transcriptional regulator [Aliarcobacter lanthieri]QKF58207.1 transcriptional regulator, AraC family [Aliarcobacter lanthieri]